MLRRSHCSPNFPARTLAANRLRVIFSANIANCEAPQRSAHNAAVPCRAASPFGTRHPRRRPLIRLIRANSVNQRPGHWKSSLQSGNGRGEARKNLCAELSRVAPVTSSSNSYSGGFFGGREGSSGRAVAGEATRSGRFSTFPGRLGIEGRRARGGFRACRRRFRMSGDGLRHPKLVVMSARSFRLCPMGYMGKYKGFPFNGAAFYGGKSV